MANAVQTLNNIDFQSLIHLHGQEVKTTSLDVAQAFGKEHGDVLRKIDQICTQVSDSFHKRNFASMEITRENPLTGGLTKSRAFELTKDGFMLLVMGFTGKLAMAIKVAYIEAFNAMLEKVSGSQVTPNALPAPDALTKEQIGYLYQGVMNLCRDKSRFAYRAMFSELKRHFGVASYKDIPASRFNEACALVGLRPMPAPFRQPDYPASLHNTVSMLTHHALFCVGYIHQANKAIHHINPNMEAGILNHVSPMLRHVHALARAFNVDLKPDAYYLEYPFSCEDYIIERHMKRIWA